LGEVELAAMLCAFLAGSNVETRQYFDANDLSRYVRVDCETPTHVIEIGLDGSSSARDSVHQAVFYGLLTGKTPMVILIDQDGYEGRYEYEIRRVATHLGIEYGVCDRDFIVRWASTAPFRDIGVVDAVCRLPNSGRLHRRVGRKNRRKACEQSVNMLFLAAKARYI